MKNLNQKQNEILETMVGKLYYPYTTETEIKTIVMEVFNNYVLTNELTFENFEGLVYEFYSCFVTLELETAKKVLSNCETLYLQNLYN